MLVRRASFRMTGGDLTHVFNPVPTGGRAEARPYTWWYVVWRGLWWGNRQKGDDVRPFGLALREIAKNLWKRRPRAESSFDGARVIFSLAPVCATRRYLPVPADGAAPIFQQFTVR